MVYVEYISRRAGIDLADFQRVVTQVQHAWESGFSDDRLILSAGRTWRLGPEPAYLSIWYTPQAGLSRLDEWTQAFRVQAVVDDEANMSRVARIDGAGCYEPLLDPRPARHGLYYVEWFRPAADDTDIAAFYQESSERFPQLILNLVARRIGRLAPDPGGLAVWTVPDFARLGEIAAALDRRCEPVELTGAGVYTDIGQEIL